MTAATDAVRDGRPPRVVVSMLNPIMRTMLGSPLGRMIRPLALLEFSGRKTNRSYRIPVGWYEVDDTHAVFTPAPWRTNFAGGRPATVRYRGQRHDLIGTLDTDATAVAATIAGLLEKGVAPGQFGLKVDPGHKITASDVQSLGRAMIRFRPGPAPGRAFAR